MARPAIQPGRDIVGQRASMFANVRVRGSDSSQGGGGGTLGGGVIDSHATQARRSAGPRRPSLRASVRRNTGSARGSRRILRLKRSTSRAASMACSWDGVASARGLRLDREASLGDPVRAAKNPILVHAVRIANKLA